MQQDFDAVVVALPYNRLQDIEWAGERLRRAMARHVADYDRPGHYLRISILFDRPFWRRLIAGSWVMLDAFGGCCVYDERTPHDAGGHGVLGWLVAGADALSLCNADDQTLMARALESLPDELYDASAPALRRRQGASLGRGGERTTGRLSRARPVCRRISPSRSSIAGLVVVGDYLFDSTLNGVLRSAHIATELVHDRLRERRWLRAAS